MVQRQKSAMMVSRGGHEMQTSARKGACNLRCKRTLIIAIAIASILQILNLFSLSSKSPNDFNWFDMPPDGRRELSHTSSVSRRNMSQKSFVVWMFPLPPKPDQDRTVHADETLVCPYSNACPQQNHHHQGNYLFEQVVNLKSLTENSFFENYVRDHAWHKVRHWQDFSSHIQVITILSLLRTYPGSCARTLGSSYQICNPNAYPDYDPYSDPSGGAEFPIENSGEEESFPKALLLEHGNSLVPNMTAERFAIYGVHGLEESAAKQGRYNTGNDVQWLASAHWLPYITDVLHWKDALQDYKGHLIGNALLNLFTRPREIDMEAMRRVSLVSIFSSMNLVQNKANVEYFRRYTNDVEPFGSRSTVTHRQLLQANFKAYFSACLTLTIQMQGATLSNPKGYSRSMNAMEVTQPTRLRLGGTKSSTTHNGIFIVDPADESIIPPAIRQRAIRLYADIPRSFPLDPRPYRARIGYAYRLLSQYAKEAKVIITSRIHVGLPSFALGVPVIFIKSENGGLPGGHERSGRVAGLTELFHNIDMKLGDNWTFGEHASELVVPPNPGNHAADRYRASFWNRLKRESRFYEDTAKLFGMVPFKRLGLVNKRADVQETFHFVLDQADMMYWQSRRAVELVFYFHPNAQVYVHSNDLSGDATLETFVDSGYNLLVLPYDVAGLAAKAGVKLSSDVGETSRVATYLLLKKYGGVFLSRRTFLRKEIPVMIDSGVIMGGSNGTEVAMMIYNEPRSSSSNDEFSRSLMEQKLEVAEPSWKVELLSPDESNSCMSDVSWYLASTGDNVLGVSLAYSVSKKSVRLDTQCHSLLEAKCIYCDEVHVEFEDQ